MSDILSHTRNQIRSAWMILTTSVLLGTLQTFIVPIWANVEETGHFEYVRYLMDHGALPPENVGHQPELYDAMYETLIWSHGGLMANSHFAADLDVENETDWIILRTYLLQDDSGQQLPMIGDVQLGEPPGYYVLAALAVWPFRDASLSTQLACVFLRFPKGNRGNQNHTGTFRYGKANRSWK